MWASYKDISLQRSILCMGIFLRPIARAFPCSGALVARRFPCNKHWHPLWGDFIIFCCKPKSPCRDPGSIAARFHCNEYRAPYKIFRVILIAQRPPHLIHAYYYNKPFFANTGVLVRWCHNSLFHFTACHGLFRSVFHSAPAPHGEW